MVVLTIGYRDGGGEKDDDGGCDGRDEAGEEAADGC